MTVSPTPPQDDVKSMVYSGEDAFVPSENGATTPVIGDVEAAILEVLPFDGMCFSFRALEAQLQDLEGESRFNRATIEAGVRLLAARGFAHFRRGLFDEDGGTYGSGYGITDAGQNYARQALKGRV